MDLPQRARLASTRAAAGRGLSDRPGAWPGPAIRLQAVHATEPDHWLVADTGRFAPRIARRVGLGTEPRSRPLEVTIGSDRRAWWRCAAHGHSWQSRVKSRARGSGCPFCSNKKVLPGFNDLATVNPELAAYWHPTLNGNWLPTMVTARSSRRVYWLCAEGHVSYGPPASKCTVRGIVYSCRECHLDRRATRRTGPRDTSSAPSPVKQTSSAPA